MPFPWGAVIGAAGSVLGSVLGSGSKTIGPGKALKKTVRAARESNIHPLAALGASSAYTVPGSGVGQGIGDAARELGSAIDNMRDPAKKSAVAVNVAQADLLKAQTNAINQEIAANARGGTTGARNVSDPSSPPDISYAVNSAPGVGRFPQPDTDPSAKVPNLFRKVRTATGDRIVPNMEVAADPETDLWSHVVKGDVAKYVDKLAERNGLYDWQKRNREGFVRLLKSGASVFTIDKHVEQAARRMSKRSAAALRTWWKQARKTRAPDLGPGPQSP